MESLSVTQILNQYRVFDKAFWVQYKALEAIMPKEKFEEIKMPMLKSKKIPKNIFELVDECQFLTKRDEIDQEWTKKNEDAKALGTSVHDAIRNAFVTDICRARQDFQVEGDMLTTEKFLSAQNGLFSEQRMEIILDPEYTLIGIPDLVCIHNGIVDIIDFKTSEEPIKFHSIFDFGKKKTKRMKHPLGKLEDAEGVRYQLQVSIYMWMLLQLRPELKSGKLKLLWIKDMKVKRSYEVEYLEKEVETLLKWHIKATKLKKETDKCKELKY